MNRYHSKMRRFICVFLSATLFTQSGYSAAPGLSQEMINEAKTFFNKSAMGKSQTVGEWFEKIKPLIDKKTITDLTPWLNENKHKLLPSLSVTVKKSSKLGNYLSLTFQIEGNWKKIDIQRDAKGSYLSFEDTILRDNEFKIQDFFIVKNEQSSTHNKNTNKIKKQFDPSLSYNEFSDYAKKDPNWGIRYLNALRNTYAEMEKAQITLFKNKKSNKKTNSFYSLAIPKSYAASEEEVKECIIAGWIGIFKEDTGYCTKGDKSGLSGEAADFNKHYVQYNCPDSTNENPLIDCEPMLYSYKDNGERHCVPLKPKEKVSSDYCADIFPIRSPDDLKKMTDQNDKILKNLGKNDEENFSMNRLRGMVGAYQSTCFTSDQYNSIKANSISANGSDVFSTMIEVMKTNPNTEKGGFTHYFEENYPKLNDSPDKDRNYHNRMACEATFRRLAFLDDIVKEKKNSNNSKPTCANCTNITSECVPASYCTNKDSIKKDSNTFIKDDKNASSTPLSEKICPIGRECFQTLGAILGTTAFLLWLFGKKRKKGEKGDPGKDGAPGISIKGDPGSDGKDGRDGKDGSSTVIIIHDPKGGTEAPPPEESEKFRPPGGGGH